MPFNPRTRQYARFVAFLIQTTLTRTVPTLISQTLCRPGINMDCFVEIGLLQKHSKQTPKNREHDTDEETETQTRHHAAAAPRRWRAGADRRHAAAPREPVGFFQGVERRWMSVE